MIRVLALVIALAVSPAFAQSNEPPTVARIGWFDPSTYYSEHWPHRITIVRVNGWEAPVAAIALRGGCPHDAQNPDGCEGRWFARMLRSPTQTANARSGALTADLEWLEADVSSCPGAQKRMLQLEHVRWVGTNVLHAQEHPPGTIVVPSPRFHWPRAIVQVDHWMTSLRYEGYLDVGTPGGWVVDLFATLEPCWRPSSAPPPWAN